MTLGWWEILFVLASAQPPALFEEADRPATDEYEVEVMTSQNASVVSLETIEEEGGEAIPYGNVYFATLGGKAVAVLDAADPDLPVVLATLHMQHAVVDIEVEGSRLVVVLESNEMLTYGIENPRVPVLLGSRSLPEAAKALGIQATVEAVEEGYAILDAGEHDGVLVGMRFAIVTGGSPRAIVVIDRTTAHRSWGKLPPRGSASAGDPAYETEEVWRARSWMFPFPEPGYLQLAIDLMPIVGVSRGKDTWGFQSDLRLMYRFRLPLELGVVLYPAGFGHSDGGNGGVFELGLMFGYSAYKLGIATGAGAHVSGSFGKDKALWLNRFRFGCEEGLNLTVDLDWVIPSVYDDGRMILPSTFVATLSVPVHRRIVIYGVAGGGNPAIGARSSMQAGWARLLLGARTLVRGSSGRGAVFLSLGAGYGYVWDHSPFNVHPAEGGFTAGVLIHVGVEMKI